MIGNPPKAIGPIKCRDCDQEIWLQTSKNNKKYPTNSETDRRDFHNCKQKEAKKKGAKFGNEAKTRQLDLSLPPTQSEETATGPRIIAFVAFPKGATVADAKAILARLGDDVQKVSITRTVE